MPESSTFLIEDEAALAAFAAQLAGQLPEGAIILLKGDMGAGKTAFARAIIRTLLGQPGLEVPSPTFQLVLPYEGSGFRVHHADLYRLSDDSELEELGLFDDPATITLIEWPERVTGLDERADLVIAFEIPKDQKGRKLTVTLPAKS